MVEDDSDEERSSRKPIPVRRTAGHARRSPTRRRKEDSGEEGTDRRKRRRPTPVRESLDAAPPSGEPRWEDAPSRHFSVEDTEWIARIVGRTLAGTGRETPKAPVMELHFARSEEPETPLLRLLVAGQSLDAYYDEELENLLHRSKPVSDAGSDDGGFLEGRPGKRGGRRGGRGG